MAANLDDQLAMLLGCGQALLHRGDTTGTELGGLL
jgi:hypothetical protein